MSHQSVVQELVIFLRVAVYIRVSTLEQALAGYSISEQKERLTAYCKARGWVIVDFYVDPGYTGANLDRPGMQRLIADVEKFDVVLVYKLDRLSRSQRDTLYLIEEVFLPANTDFVSLSESFDTSTPFGRAMIGILSVFAQLEREQIRERSAMGRVARAKEGLYHGGNTPPIGYDYVDGQLVINEYEAAQIRYIYNWYLEGTSPVAIGDRLRDSGYTNRYSSWSSNSVRVSIYRLLSNPVYIGTLDSFGIITENAHAPIIEREQFDAVQILLKKRGDIWGSQQYMRGTSLLGGFVVCGRCGARYFGKCAQKKYNYYECYSRAGCCRNMKRADSCDNKIWKREELDAVVEAEIKKLLFSPRYFDALSARSAPKSKKQPSEVDVLTKNISKLDKQIGRFMDLYQNDSIPADVLSARIDALYRERTGYAAQLAAAAPDVPAADFGIDGIRAMLADFAAVWDIADFTQRRRILQALINRIVLDGDQVKIEWSFLEE